MSELLRDDRKLKTFDQVTALLMIYVPCNTALLMIYVPYTYHVIISPNEVFGDIMVLASQPSRPPRRREHSNSKSIQPISFKFYMRVDTPLRFFAIEI